MHQTQFVQRTLQEIAKGPSSRIDGDRPAPSVFTTRATLIPPPPGSWRGSEHRSFSVLITRAVLTERSIAGLRVRVAIRGIARSLAKAAQD